MRREIPLFSDGLRMYSHRLSTSSLASKFDGGENAKRRRLHGRRFAVNLRRPLSVERNHVVVTVPIGTLCARTVIVYPRCRQGSAREITAGRRPSADLIPGRVCTRDVWASKAPRSTRHPKGEPPLQKRGLPLAAASLFGGRVPLGPREAVEHPGTTGTVLDVVAPVAHDGAPSFQKVRSLIRPRHLRADRMRQASLGASRKV